MLLTLALLLSAAAPAPPPEACPIDENFSLGRTAGLTPSHPGQFTPQGWKVTSPSSQIKYDLGRSYRQGRVEFEVLGPLEQKEKFSLFSAWNEEAAADGDRKTQGFFQLRLIDNGMMLRLTYRPGGKSFEKAVAPLAWQNKWYKIEGTWDTAGGNSTLLRDGQPLQTGQFNGPFEGFRWIFIGKDNYQGFKAIPGLTYRRLKVCVSDPAIPPTTRKD